MNYMWLPICTGAIDIYGAFRGSFQLAQEATVEIHTFGCHFFNTWLDGRFFCEGPARFILGHPEYNVTSVSLKAGTHLIAALVHNEGVSNRLIRGDVIPPFFSCRVLGNDKEILVSWKCKQLEGYRPQVNRIASILGWIEWCDMVKNPDNWQLTAFDDTAWTEPAPVEVDLGRPEPLSTGPVKRFVHQLRPIAEGRLSKTRCPDGDISTRFSLRELVCDKLPPQGLWRRYDLGRVRLGKPCFRLDLPAEAVVEFAYSETLANGRVSPHIAFVPEGSCNLDHYTAREGVQEFMPLTPKGGRFMEVHIMTDPNKIKFIEEKYIERGYFDQPEGVFSCGDELLNRIWSTGVRTLKACAEDAIVDTPYRERGQWIGDSLSVGLDIAAVAFSDLRLFKRAIRHSAWGANDQGLVAGMCSGELFYLPAYSLQWVTANLHYYELTGDHNLLTEMYPYAVQNMSAFEAVVTDAGLREDLGENFIDWGYSPEKKQSDMAYNLRYLCALRDMVRWCEILRVKDAEKYRDLEKHISEIIDHWLKDKLSGANKDWPKIGYHVTSLALSLGLFAGQEELDAIDYMKKHMLSCFPNNPDAPRLTHTDIRSRQLITPYFCNFALPPLIERGEMDFVLGQYRKCWGWALEDGRTTWVEVFDINWSHSHHWSGCPTWQLSRYVLGLHPRFDLGMNHFEFKFFPGSLSVAKGRLPLPDSMEMVHVEWTRKSDGIHYELKTGLPIWLHPADPESGEYTPAFKIHAEYKVVLPCGPNLR